jgi:hypothetical protein
VAEEAGALAGMRARTRRPGCLRAQAHVKAPSEARFRPLDYPARYLN